MMLKRLLLACLLTCLSSSPLYAQVPALEKQDLEPFIDGVMAAHMKDQDIPGAVITLVKDGNVILAKGYGYADVESKTPVIPEKTLFRPASITKLFVWTAIMQLVEAEKLVLDEDINTYMKLVEIPATFPEPITIRHLMTHTPGFEDKGINLFSRDGEVMELPSHQILNTEMPTRVYPPGEVPAYSNYGVALAGHIIEQVTGVPFPQYLKKHVLQPLDMQHTTLLQPVPNTLRSNAANGYVYIDGAYQVRPFEFVPLAPAGGLSTTAADMAKFMLAHLQGGSGVLKPETTALLHSPELAGDVVQNRVHGFYEANYNGIRTIGHGGDTIYFHSGLLLVPTHQLGIFVSYNSEGGAEARGTLFKAFFDRYFPYVADPVMKPDEGFQRRASRLTGVYQTSRRNHTTIEKLGTLVGGLVTVSVTDSDTLMLHGSGTPVEWIELEPLLYRRADNADTLQFVADQSGNITTMMLENSPTMVLQKLDWLHNPDNHIIFLQLALLLSLIATLFVFRSMDSTTAEPMVALFTRRLAALNGALCLVFFISLFMILASTQELVFGLPWHINVLLVLPWIIAVLTVLVGLMVLVFAWPGTYWDLRTRVFYTLFAIASAGIVWFMHYWNMLSYFF